MYKEFSINTNELKNTLNAIQGICQKRTISDDTSNVTLYFYNNDNLIKASDNETSIEIYINPIFKEKLNEKIEITLNAKRFFDIIKDINDEEINIKVYPEQIIIFSYSYKINLSLSLKKDYQFNSY